MPDTFTDIFRKAGVNADQDERAKTAIKVFRALQPTLSAYARMLTKRSDVRVEMAARDNGSTDGKRIFYRPPIALGDKTPHVRKLCDKRDEYLLQRCPACMIREDVLVTIYHEISHIVYDSFQPTTDKDRREMIQAAIDEHGGKYAEAIKRRIESAPDYTKASYIGMAGLVSPFLPFLVNALEDARVNRELHKARKGTKKMFDASTQKVFREGVEQKDEYGNIVVVPWSTYPQNMQVMIGLYCIASGYNYSGWFIPPVETALGDEKLNDLIKRLDTVRTAAGVYNLSFPILARLRELGFCKYDEDPEEESEESEDDGTASESEDGDTGDDPGESGGESSGSSADGSESDDSREGSSGSGERSELDSGDHSVDEDSGGDGESSDDSSPDDDGSDGSAGDSREDSGSDGSPREGSSEGSGRGEEEQEEEVGDKGADIKPAENDESLPGTGDIEVSSDLKSGSGESAEKSDSGLEDDEVIDTGADKGEGGIEVIEDESWDDIPMGTPEEVGKAIKIFGDHDDPPKTIVETKREESEKAAVDLAIIQGIYFEHPSRNVVGVREHQYGVDTDGAWNSYSYLYTGYTKKSLGVEGDFMPPESVLGPALLQMRITFADNARSKEEYHLKSGRVNARVLGKRAPMGDPRLFLRRSLPGKKKYFVLIGIDVSGSTVGVNIGLAKRAAYAQAELCNRMGIDFAVYAHSGSYAHSTRSGGFELDIYVIKKAHEPWDPRTQERLHNIGPDSANLDGHSVEYYRKRLDEVDATDKIILYYSDGKMPQENFEEELDILKREIRTCKQRKYVLLGVGIRTDSPRRHGLDTVQVNTDEDLIKVIQQLEKALLAT